MNYQLTAKIENNKNNFFETNFILKFMKFYFLFEFFFCFKINFFHFIVL